MLHIKLSVLVLVVCTASVMMAGPYKNKIIEIREVKGPGSYGILIRTSNPYPILTYAPRNYQEACNRDYRAFLPNTTLLESVSLPENVVEVTPSGIAIKMPGFLRSEIIGNGSVFISVNTKKRGNHI